MIKIRKGTQILDVPKKAFTEFYEGAGWARIVKKSEKPSAWEQQIQTSSLQQLRKLAKEREIEIAGASKRTLIELLLAKGE